MPLHGSCTRSPTADWSTVALWPESEISPGKGLLLGFRRATSGRLGMPRRHGSTGRKTRRLSIGAFGRVRVSDVRYEQQMTVHDGLGYFDELAPGVLRVIAKHGERRV
jgi:hypothetical protein